ncbi:MAG TPA: hypothetical protein VFH58_04225 [Acidimicrobiales bacterium]|nr:hypothetical protein [Acidimicrobiales bacterium]
MATNRALRGLVALCAAAAVSIGAGTAARAAGAPVGGVGLPQLPGAGPTAHTSSSSGGGTVLTGTFKITAGSCSGGISGSWFRMLTPTGGPVSNSNSPCSDQTYTPLTPGTDGGLVTGGYQPDPSPAFDGAGNGLARRIFQPAKFYGVEFSVATDPTDPQTGAAVAAPSISSSGGNLSGDLRAITVSWNNQHFNQGAPKPDGTRPGKTSGPTGTYNPATGAYKITWASQIVGGPFNNFTGTWQIEGTFVPAATPAAAPSTSNPSNTSAATPATSTPPAGSAGGGAAPGASGGPATDPSLPTTGGRLPLLPAAGLLSAGLVVRRLSRSGGSRRARR